MPLPSTPVLSVVVPSHRGSHRLPALLDALAVQRLDEPWEVVVVVDGRDNPTETLLAEEDARGRLPLVVVVRETSTGVAGALNAGLAVARGDVVVRCDDDLTPGPDVLARHLAHHRAADGPVGVIGPTRDVLPESRYALAYGRAASERSVSDVLARPADELWRHWAAHNSAPRAALEAVGGADESFSYREDSDLGLRLAAHGLRLVVDPELVVPHRGAARTTAVRAARAWVSGASEVLFAARHPEVSTAAGPAPERPADRLWSRLVARRAERMTTRDAAQEAGARVDRLIRFLPLGLAGRLVALVVEAAAVGGRANGELEQSGLRAQKDAELALEQGEQPRR